MASVEMELELAVRRMQGETIERVHYLDAWPGAERGALGDRDDVGLAVFLTCKSGRCHEVRWADELGLRHGFGLALREVAMPDGDRGKLVDVTKRWSSRAKAKIARATLVWGDARAARSGFASFDHRGRGDYPHALALELSSKHVVTFETPFANALAVVFTERSG